MSAPPIVGADTSKTYIPASGLGTVTDVTNLPYPLGTVITKITDGVVRRYKLVLVEDLVTVAGQLVCYTTDANGYEVTTDRAGGTSDNSLPAGMIETVIPDGAVGWIQTYGLNTVALVTDGTVAAGDLLVAHATTNGGADVWAATDLDVLGFGNALVADTSTALAIGEAFLDCLGG